MQMCKYAKYANLQKEANMQNMQTQGTSLTRASCHFSLINVFRGKEMADFGLKLWEIIILLRAGQIWVSYFLNAMIEVSMVTVSHLQVRPSISVLLAIKGVSMLTVSTCQRVAEQSTILFCIIKMLPIVIAFLLQVPRLCRRWLLQSRQPTF